MPATAHISLPGIEAVGWHPGCSSLLGFGYGYPDSPGYCGSDFVLNRKHVLQRAIIAVRPDVIAGLGIEEVFGWMKTVGGLRKTRHCGTTLVAWMFTLAAAAYNVVRIPKLLAAAT
jgi:hypothetical protein